MAITDFDALGITLNEDEKAWNPDGPNTLPFMVTPHIASLISNEAIRRQFIPTSKENEDERGFADPQEEKEHEEASRVIHRYRNRVAFFTTDRCFAYCRHCFRRRLAGQGLAGAATDDEIIHAAEYVASQSEVREVLLTGGDFFTLSDKKIGFLLDTFKRTCPNVILRFCTRAVFSYPERFTDRLMEIIKERMIGAPFFLMTQFNHPAELTQKAVEAVSKFVSIGIPAFNQSVLLKGINDSPDTLEELSNKLLLARIKPYYLFQDDPVKGTSHFRVPIEEGLKIEKELRIRLSGLGMPQYTADLPQGGGKVIITNQYYKEKTTKDGIDRYIFTTPEGETRSYPD